MLGRSSLQVIVIDMQLWNNDLRVTVASSIDRQSSLTTLKYYLHSLHSYIQPYIYINKLFAQTQNNFILTLNYAEKNPSYYVSYKYI